MSQSEVPTHSAPVSVTRSQRNVALAALGLIATIVALSCAGLIALFWPDDPGGQITQTPPPIEYTEYTVQSGDILINVAAAHGIPWQQLMLAIEPTLQANWEKHCGNKSQSYRERNRGGYYCRETLTFDGKPIVQANSIKAGDHWKWPKYVAPATVEAAVAAIPGKKIVVVIDDTGSMTEDKAQVSAWYMQTIEQSGKEVTQVILYADGGVRTYGSKGKIDFRTTGDVENTRSALEAAAAYKPDAIVLVSDEPGDDWGNWRVSGLPPVIAHSLDRSADENLERVATQTGGQFLRNLGSTNLATR